jgi:hypothetical protein
VLSTKSIPRRERLIFPLDVDSYEEALMGSTTSG